MTRSITLLKLSVENYSKGYILLSTYAHETSNYGYVSIGTAWSLKDLQVCIVFIITVYRAMHGMSVALV